MDGSPSGLSFFLFEMEIIPNYLAGLFEDSYKTSDMKAFCELKQYLQTHVFLITSREDKPPYLS
jgi:hypothetical protein